MLGLSFRNRRAVRALALAAVAAPLVAAAVAQGLLVPQTALQSSAMKRGDALNAPIQTPVAIGWTPSTLSEASEGWIPGTTIQVDRATGQVRRLRGSIDYGSAANPEDAARKFLIANGSHFGLSADLRELRLVRQVESPMGFHLTYEQSFGGQVVFGGLVSVHMDHQQNILLVNNEILPIGVSSLRPARVTANAAIAAARKAVGLNPTNSPQVELGVQVSKAGAALAWKVSYVTSNPGGDWETFVDAQSGVVTSLRNIARYVDGSGQVFNVNPCVSSGNPSLVDNNDADSAVLTSQLIPVTLRGLDGSGFLTGPFATTAPTSTQPRANSPTNVFNYTRFDDRFEEVMCYYYVDGTQRYIQSLGFMNVNNRPVGVDVNGTTVDNSWYTPSTKNLTFGTGGVDDAEDADVIWHEYGHSIQDNQVPGWGNQEEGGAMGEGFGDYWAATQGAGVGPLGNAWDVYIAEWDAVSYNPGNPGFLRRLDSTKHYPENMDGEVHDDGEIWSACLWQIRTAIGKTRADRIILQSHFLLTPNAQFQDGANAILQANQSLYGGQDQSQIRSVFVNRGILQVYSAPGSLQAAMNGNNVQLTWSDTNNNEDGYRVERQAFGGSFSEIGTTNANAVGFLDNTAVAGTMYQYRVRAFGAEGNGGYSNIAAVTTALPTYSISGAITFKGGKLQDSVTATSTGTFNFLASGSPELAIPDNNSTGVTATIPINQTGTITAVKVGVNLSHTYIGDLEIALIHPDGTVVLLHNRSGGGTDDLWTMYPTPTAPSQSLSVLNGKAANGNWSLRIRDLANVDTGVLHNWFVQVTFNGTQTASVNTAFGAYSIGNLLPGTYTVTPAPITGVTFSPASRSVTVAPSQTNQNFLPVF